MVEILTEADIVMLVNPGVISEQLLSPHNSASRRLTMTRVTVQPGAMQPRHAHDDSEQIWVALRGEGRLLLADERTSAFRGGMVARFAEGDVHGFENTGTEPFVYMTATSPPLNFETFYARKGPGAAGEEEE